MINSRGRVFGSPSRRTRSTRSFCGCQIFLEFLPSLDRRFDRAMHRSISAARGLAPRPSASRIRTRARYRKRREPPCDRHGCIKHRPVRVRRAILRLYRAVDGARALVLRRLERQTRLERDAFAQNTAPQTRVRHRSRAQK